MSHIKRILVAILVTVAGFSGGVKDLLGLAANAATSESKEKSSSGGTTHGAYAPTATTDKNERS